MKSLRLSRDLKAAYTGDLYGRFIIALKLGVPPPPYPTPTHTHTHTHTPSVPSSVNSSAQRPRCRGIYRKQLFLVFIPPSALN